MTQQGLPGGPVPVAFLLPAVPVVLLAFAIPSLLPEPGLGGLGVRSGKDLLLLFGTRQAHPFVLQRTGADRDHETAGDHPAGGQEEQQRCAFREPGDRQGDRHPRQARELNIKVFMDIPFGLTKNRTKAGMVFDRKFSPPGNWLSALIYVAHICGNSILP